MRKFLQSWPGKLILVGTLIPMAFLGVQGTFGGAEIQPNQLIKVGDQVVDLSTYQAEVNALRAELMQQIDASMINEDALAKQVLDNMVNRALLENQSIALGMTVSDETITRLLQQDASFQDANGQFSNDLFAQFLQQRGMTKDTLFQTFRLQLSLRQLNASILGTAIYPNSQVSYLLDLQRETREVWVQRLNWQDYVDQVQITNAQIDAYFNENKDTLVSPETVDLTYLELDPQTLKIDTPTEDEIRAQYASYLKEKGISDGRELAQILLTGGDADKTAAEIKAKLDAGESFEALAKQYSQDPSGETGGNIGSFNPSVFGQDAAAVEQALNGLGAGQVSAPVKTSFGTQIFKITAVNSNAPSLESLRDELINRAATYKREAAFADLSARINALATDGVGIADIAKEVGVEAKSIKAYPRINNQTALSQPVVIAAAFDEFTIADQGVSANITVGEKNIWVQPTNHQTSRALSLAEATPQIKTVLAKQKATELAYADAQKQASDAKAGGASRLMTAANNRGKVTRLTPTLSAQELASLFLHKSADGNDVWAVQTADGASIIVGGPVEEISESQLSPADRARTALLLRENIGDDQLKDYLRYLKDTNEVIINEDALKAQQ